MKILLISTLLFIFYSNLYSQDIKYVSVSPKINFHSDNSEDPYENFCSFQFTLNTLEAHQYKYCDISFALDEIGEYGIAINTGWDYEFLEDKNYYTINTMDSAYCEFNISTLNLPKMEIIIGYNGNKRNIKIYDVTIQFKGSKY